MAALKLRPVRHVKGDANRYCGPSVISALTGMNSGEAARLLRAVSGKASIKGASTFAVRAAFRRCGVGVQRIWKWPAGHAPTLAAWLRDTHGERGGRVFLIVAGNHFQAVSGNRFVCGKTGDIVGLDHPKVKRRARVETVLELMAAPQGLMIPASARKPKARPDVARSVRSAAKALAAAHGIEIEQHTDLDSKPWFVSHPDLIDTPEDPWDGDHYVHDWDEVLHRVKGYVATLANKRDAA